MKEGAIPMYDAAEFLSNRDATGIIGFGSFGRVRDCFHKKLGRVAVKCFGIQGTAQDAEELRQKLSSEAEILQNINHHQIVQCQGVTVWSNAFGIIMEYMIGGNLDEFLVNDGIPEISWGLKLRIIEELCEALAFLHYFTKVKTIVHGDLKPHNILLTADLHAKLADFGAAQIALSTGSSSTLSESISRQHTVLYTAPEFLQNINMARTAAMDIYSLSMIIYEVITRTRVFHGVSGNIGLIISTIVNCGQRPDMKHVISVKKKLQTRTDNDVKQDLQIFNLLETTMQKCWHETPAKRPQVDVVRDDLSEELSLVSTGDLIINVGEIVRKMKLSKSRRIPTMVPLNQFMFPFEIANSRKMSKIHSRSSLKTQAAGQHSCIIIFVASDENRCDVIKYFPDTKSFEKLPPLMKDWNDSTAIVLKKCLYVLSSNSVECLDLGQENPHWMRRPAMIIPRTHAAAAAHQGKIYVFGGIAEGNKVLSSVECFDPEMESWSVVDNMKRHRFGHKVLEASSKLYSIGGPNTIVECYDPVTKESCEVTDTPNRNGFATVYSKGIIYDIGRTSKLRSSVKGTKSTVVRYTVDCYNIHDGFWYKGSELTTNRSQGCACALNDKIFVIGGWDKLTSCQYIESYDPVKDQWETVNSMSFGFVQHVCSVE